MGEISVKTGNNARNGGKNSLNRLIRCVCGKKIGPEPRNFNQRVSLGRNDLLIRTFPSAIGVSTEWIRGFVSGEEDSLKANCDGLAKELQKLPDEEITTLERSFRLKLEQCQALDTLIELNEPQENREQSPDTVNPFDKTDSELLISIYRSMDEPERQNLYRIVCLRSKELNALLEHHSQNILPNY
ncbi:hypothetical protein ACRZ34_004130 [Citrobacter koseri]